MWIGLHVKCPSFFSDFNETWILLMDFRKILKYQISWKSVQWERSCSFLTDSRRDMMKLIVAFRNFSKAPRNGHICMPWAGLESFFQFSYRSTSRECCGEWPLYLADGTLRYRKYLSNMKTSPAGLFRFTITESVKFSARSVSVIASSDLQIHGDLRGLLRMMADSLPLHYNKQVLREC